MAEQRRRRRAGKPAAEAEAQTEEKQESWISTVTWALAIAFVVKSFFLDTFWIPSGSMEPSLDVGDFIVVTKWSYGYNRHSLMFDPPIFKGQRVWGSTPKRGDVVVFDSTHPQDDRSEYREIENGGYHVIKRVIGLPGDKVTIVDGLISVESLVGERFSFTRDLVSEEQVIEQRPRGDGSFLPQPGIFFEYEETTPEGRSYISREIQDLRGNPDFSGLDNWTMGQGTYGDHFVDGRVPEGHVFVMGDNRDRSDDGRRSLRSVPLHKVVGKAQITLFSIGDSWLPRWDRFFRPIR